jgi:dTDP-4-dehydrorhamnose reductase
MPELAYQVNVLPNKYLIQLCKKLNIHPILISTDHVFDGLNGPYEEQSNPQPLRGAIYSEQKATSESYFLPLVEKEKASIIRASTLIGISEPYQRQNIYIKVIQKIMVNQQVLGAIDKFRTPSHVFNLAFLLHYLMENNIGGIFHLPGEYLNEYQLFRLFVESLDLNPNLIVPIEISKSKEDYPLNAGLKANKMNIRYLSLKEALFLLSKDNLILKKNVSLD